MEPFRCREYLIFGSIAISLIDQIKLCIFKNKIPPKRENWKKYSDHFSLYSVPAICFVTIFPFFFVLNICYSTRCFINFFLKKNVYSQTLQLHFSQTFATLYECNSVWCFITQVYSVLAFSVCSSIWCFITFFECF